MKDKEVTMIALTLLLIGTLTLAFDIPQAGAPEPPATEWTRTYIGDGDEYAYSMVQTSDGGYALAGETDSFGAGDRDFWLLKTNSSGHHEWNKTYGRDDWEIPYSVVHTNDGGYALVGYTNPGGNSDFWLVKVDSSGNHQWNKTYGGANHDAARSVVKTSDGGFALAGYTTSFGDASGDLWLIKVDSSGNHQWNKTYGGTGGDGANSVIQTSDGGYALAGSTHAFGAVNRDFWLVKVDSSGNHQWNKTYGGNSTDEANSVVETSDGGYALTGHKGIVIVEPGYYGEKFWLVKTDSFGNHEWNKTYGEKDVQEAYSVVATSDGGYALAGYTASFWEPGMLDFWLVKVDPLGIMQWNKTYGGGNSDTAYSIVETSDGGFALGGYTGSFGVWADFCLVKVAGPPPTVVGGIYIPVNKLELVAPYIGLTILLALAAATVVYVKTRKKQ